MFELTYKPIVVQPLKTADKRAGGWVSFEGRVRSENEGRQVLELEYEVYPALVLSEGKKIIEDAVLKFNLLEAFAIHRFGKLAIGDTAVWVSVAAMHRKQAFDGAEYIIETIKHHLPIWKKEWYRDGTFQWVNCQHDRKSA